MYLLPAPFIVVVCLLAGVGWWMFARSQQGRFQSRILAWLGLPFFFVAGFYLWFSLQVVDIELRASYARVAISTIAVSQGIILIVLSLYQWWTHGKDK
jgi:FtsH-binding integral membrane protein